jgi:prepilin-type N-terminal cleavage/methylation domain-containing protein
MSKGEDHLSLMKRAFTLIELIIVIAILAIIAAVAIPRYVNLREEALRTQELATIDSLRTAILLYRSQNNIWPEELDTVWRESLNNPPPVNLVSWPPSTGDGTNWQIVNFPPLQWLIFCPHINLTEGNGIIWAYYYGETTGEAGEIELLQDFGHRYDLNFKKEFGPN